MNPPIVRSRSNSQPGVPDQLTKEEVNKLEEEFRAQLIQLKQAVTNEGHLLTQKQSLINSIRSIDSATNSLAATCISIESQESAKSHQILDRLQNVVELNQIKITQAINRVKQEIEEIDAFIQETGLVSVTSSNESTTIGSGVTPTIGAHSPTPTPADMCRCLTHIREWLSHAHALSIISTEPEKQLKLDPLPHEANAHAQQLQQFQQLLALLRVKDELLRFAMAGRKGLLDEQKLHAHTLQQLYSASQVELEEWMKLSEKLSNELKSFKSVCCCFCRTKFTPQAASSPCPNNRSSNSTTAPTYSLEGTRLVDERREGDGLHYFVPI